MRAVAILLVVFTHIPMENFFIHIEKDTFSLQRLFYALFQNGTVVFVFISGYLFNLLNKTLNYKNYLLKKVNYVILPYIIIFTCCLFFRWLTGIEKIPLFLTYSNHIKTILLSYVFNGWVLAPLWFIPMITLFFITAPIIKFIVDSRYSVFYVFISLIISFGTLRPWASYNPALSFVHFFGIYLLGCFLAKGNADKLFSSNKTTLTLLVLFFVSITESYKILGTYYPTSSLELQIISRKIFIDWMTIQKTILCLLLYGFSQKKYTKSYSLIKLIADYSFGVFFIHGIILAFYLKALKITTEASSTNSITFIPTGIFIFTISMIIVYIAKIILKGKSKYVIGC